MKQIKLKMSVSFEREVIYPMNDKITVDDFRKEIPTFKAQAIKALKREFGDNINNVNIIYLFEEVTQRKE